MTPQEITALNNIQKSLTALCEKLSVPHGAETTRDALKAFYGASMAELAAIADENGGNSYVVQYDTASVMQSFDDAFADAIEDEERAEPRIDNRQYSTYNVVNGRVG